MSKKKSTQRLEPPRISFDYTLDFKTIDFRGQEVQSPFPARDTPARQYVLRPNARRSRFVSWMCSQGAAMSVVGWIGAVHCHLARGRRRWRRHFIADASLNGITRRHPVAGPRLGRHVRRHVEGLQLKLRWQRCPGRFRRVACRRQPRRSVALPRCERIGTMVARSTRWSRAR